MTDLGLMHGWGNAPIARTFLENPTSTASLTDLVAAELKQAASAEDQLFRGALPTGLQRSYGDSTLNSGGLTLSMLAINDCQIDGDSGVAIVGAGLAIRDLEEAALQKGFFPPVVPGTGYVTIGGAIAADIHGKSHHLTGSFSAAVRRIELLYSDGVIRELFPEGPTSAHFWATIGGLGLTGIVLRVELQLRAVVSDLVEVSEVRCKDLDSLMSELIGADQDFAHTVAWIDLSGAFKGRGLVGKANYSDLPHQHVSASKKSSAGPSFPNLAGKNLINAKTVRVFNELWLRKPLASGLTPLGKYMHPLDGINNWNRIYGSQGFLQYQFVIPDGSEDLLPKILNALKSVGGASFLGVLKRFGAGNQAALSFPMAGWTLAMDFPTTLPGLEALLTTFDSWVVESRGRVYLIKDSRMRPENLAEMYPELKAWQQVRNEMDPVRLWRSDQSRRLEIC
jgi:decaprenylphospho-beta-D-ribofuranose 2-oxidase